MGKALFIAASVAPDIPTAIKLVEGKLRGVNTMTDEHQSEEFVLLKSIVHSIPLALVVVIAGIWLPLLVPTGIGWLIHNLVDLTTHGRKSYTTDNLFLWPLRADIAQYLGFWEYRIGPGVLKPKPFEAVVDAALIAFIIYRILLFLFR